MGEWGGEVEDLHWGAGLGLQRTPADAPPFSLPSLHRVGVSLLGPAGPPWESSQAATSLLGWQLRGRPWLSSKPGLKIRFLMKNCGLGANAFTGLDILAACRTLGPAEERPVGSLPVGLHSDQEADHMENLPTLLRCPERIPMCCGSLDLARGGGRGVSSREKAVEVGRQAKAQGPYAVGKERFPAF